MTGRHHRICIIGNSGSGKSTLSTELGKTLNVPVYHLDRHLLTKDFEKLSVEEYLKTHAKLIAGEDWVIDGNYKQAMEERLSRATLVVFLNVSRLITLPRVFHRVKQGGQPAHTVPDGARAERVSWQFLKWTSKYNRRERMRDLTARCEKSGVPMLILPNGSINEWIASIQSELQKED